MQNGELAGVRRIIYGARDHRVELTYRDVHIARKNGKNALRMAYSGLQRVLSKLRALHCPIAQKELSQK